MTSVASEGTWGRGGCGFGELGGEERIWIEGGLVAADAAEFELVAAHGDADAAFDAGGQLGEQVAAFERGGDGAVAEVGHFGVGEGFDFGVEGEDVVAGLGNLFGEAG